MAVSYIGSKISLISKAEIRYEGTLYSVDPKEATITLSKVRTFGTENRVTEHQMPARNEVFEFIIFKATDIKDIIVCETPNPYGGLPFDPAIVSISKGGATQQNMPILSNDTAQHSAGVPAKFPSALSSRSISPIGAQQKMAAAAVFNVASPPPSSFAPPQNRAPGAGRRDSVPTGGTHRPAVGHAGAGGGYRSTAASGPATHGFYPPSQRRRDDEDVESIDDARNRGSYGNAQGDAQPNIYRQRETAYRRGNVGGFQDRPSVAHGVRGGYAAAVAGTMPQFDRYGLNNRGGARGSFDHQAGRPPGGFIARGHVARGAGGGNFRGSHYQHQQQQQSRRFDSDYDFEKANEKFKESLNELKDDLAKANLDDGKENRDVNENENCVGQMKNKGSSGVDESESGDNTPTNNSPLKIKQSYNKTKSFFDNISCEALENMEGTNNARPNWRRERELNQETFGQAGLRNFQFRRGAGGPRGTAGPNFGGRRGGTYVAPDRNFNRYR